ncbi:MAG: hypothetical protein PHO93_02685 [Candidatus Saccharimonadaceae bacterium]|nr:hypothetical protein [Candidatus Saccharimonadaceae bacterium]
MNSKEKTKEFFERTIAQHVDEWRLIDYVPEVEKLARKSFG